MKYVVLLCGDDEDIEVVRAASGALAMLTSHSNKCCQKVFEVSKPGVTLKLESRQHFTITKLHKTYASAPELAFQSLFHTKSRITVDARSAALTQGAV